jgi:bifunctional NMN adenylyltransferase/nudix hydrolase
MDAMFSVVIGRFQPPHNGHIELFEEALSRTKKLIILVGSSEQPRSIKNPFTFEERRDAIYSALEARGVKGNRVSILSVPDAFHSDNLWIASVQAQVLSLTQGNQDILLVGHFKDSSSNYLRMFPNWKFHHVESKQNGLSATTLRDMLFSKGLAGVDDLLPQASVSLMKDFISSEDYGRLREEYDYVNSYLEAWKDTPYPVNFVTVDAVILRAGHILMVRRGEHPGKGNWALPGGFVGPEERIFDACVREIYEETGLGIVSSALVSSFAESKVFDYPHRSLRGRVITHAHFFNLGGGVLYEANPGSDAAKVEWKSLYWLFSHPHMIHEDHLSIIMYFISKDR